MSPIRLALLSATALAFVGGDALAQSTQWNVSVWGKRRAFTEHIHKIAELVEQKTNGEFTMNISYGGLSNNKENLDNISFGAIEMAQFCAGYHPDKNPAITVLELPFLGVSTLEEEVAVSHAVYDHPATKEDMARWNARMLMTSPMPQYNVAGKGQPPESLDAFDGMRIRATGGLGEAFRTIGATPTSVTSSEAYNAMESGVVDAVAFAQHAHLAFRTVDLADYWTANLNPGTVNCPVVVNIDAYESLPDAHRQALDESVEPAIDYYLQNYKENAFSQFQQAVEENGVTVVELDQSVIDAFAQQAAEPIREAWFQEMEAQGIPGHELYELTQATLEEMRQSN
ncbi:MAG: C4-dicarboxylate TRAP transporter substrate-binding protein [Paracoccaceae bacterium]